MTTLILTLIIIVLVYAFVGILSFIPFFIGLLVSVFTFPIDLLNMVYPVWILPRIILSATLLLYLPYFILHLIKH